MELPILEEYLNNLRNKEEFLNTDLTTQVWGESSKRPLLKRLQMIETIGTGLEDVVLGQRLFSDIEVCPSWPFFDNYFDGPDFLTRSINIQIFVVSKTFKFSLLDDDDDERVFSSLLSTTVWFMLTSLC